MCGTLITLTLVYIWSVGDSGETNPGALSAPNEGEKSGDVTMRVAQLPPAAQPTRERELITPAEEQYDESRVEIPTEKALMEKYKGFRGLEWVGAAKGFQFVYHKRAEALLEEKFARGAYTSQFVEIGAEFGSTTHRGMWPGDVPPTTMVRFVDVDEETTDVRQASVFPSEDPLLGALEFERTWLWEQAAPYVED